MNFSFMITIIFIILIFIKFNMQNVPNYGFLIFVIGLLGIIELYNFKENFKPYRYDGIYNRYFENEEVLHMPESSSDKKGLKCAVDKNLKIKGIQEKKFSEYRDLKNTMNNVLYGDKQFDEIQFPKGYGDISDEMSEISNVNQIVCPPVCHLIDRQVECVDAIDLRTKLNNIDELNSTKPVFNDTYMMNEAYKCLNIEQPSSRNCGEKCKLSSELNKCIYDIKKCSWDSDKKKCRKKCNLNERKGTCSEEYCTWNASKLICEEKTN